MNLQLRAHLQILTVALAAFTTQCAMAFTTSQGQLWDTEPDAWARGNTAVTSWFGWDVLEFTGPPTAPFGSFVLNDSTPDLGAPTTATGTSLAQSPASIGIYGHQSASGNYYSGFPDVADGFPFNAVADDTLTGVAPASGAGGYTTIVLQAIAQVPAQGQGANSIAGVSFIADAAWTKTSGLYGQTADGAGLYWQEWTAPGANVPFSIDITSATSSIAIDAFQVDTYWTTASQPLINSRDSIGVPEPAAVALMAIGACWCATTRTRR